MDSGCIQISAPNVEDAIQQGLSRLGLSRDGVEIDVIDQGSRGLLGLGARDATVRITPIQTSQPAEAEQTQKVQDLGLSDQVPAESIVTDQTPEYDWSHQRVTEVSRQTLSELLSTMGIEGTVTVLQNEAEDDEPAPITLNIEGDDLNVLIGRQGEVLNALQYITRLIVSREIEHWVNLVVDVQQYKQRRAKSLKQLAGRIADRVARTKQPVALEPMPPNERRAIHIALRNHSAVTTQSVGKADKRKVTIIPKR
jgi:spoIIIJ-associated protein